MTYDPAITEQIQEWLGQPAEERDIPAGALLLLRINRNKILYNNILRRGKALMPKLEYELEKNLQLRLDGVTAAEIVKMEKVVIPRAEETITKNAIQYCGKRSDHDQLPQEIRELYDINGELFNKVKNLRETLFTMDDKPACDRYEYLKLLDETDKAYRANWERYDKAEVSEGTPQPEAAGETMPTAAQVAAARKYVSDKREVLASLEPGSDEAEELRKEIQERVHTVLVSGSNFAKSTIEVLAPLGITF